MPDFDEEEPTATEPVRGDDADPQNPHDVESDDDASEELTPADGERAGAEDAEAEAEADFGEPAPAEDDGHDASGGRLGVYIVGGVLVVLLGVLGFLTLGGSGDPVYTVYGEEVYQDDLVERLTGVVDQATIEAAQDIDDASPEQRSILSRVISDFITEDAMTAAAAQEGIEISDAEVDDQVEEIIETGFGGEQEQFEAALEQSGQTLEQVRIQFRTALYAEAIVGDGGDVSDQDVQDFYDANFTAPLVSHILVPTEEEAEAALSRIEDGEAFEDVARELSIDENSAIQGGRLGPLQPGGFVAPFEEAAQALDVSEVSDPVETEFGWHVITLEPPPSREEVTDQIRSQIEENRLNGSFLELATRLDDEAQITVDEAFGTWQGLNGGGLVPAGLDVGAPQVVPPAGADPAGELPTPDSAE